MSLHTKVVRLAFVNPHIRPILLPLLRLAGAKDKFIDDGVGVVLLSPDGKRIKKDAASSKDWQAFLDAEWEGGKKKVKNTDPDSKASHPEVAMSTLIKKDKGFEKRLRKQYESWGEKADVPASKPKPKERPKFFKFDYGSQLKDMFGVGEAAQRTNWTEADTKAVRIYSSENYQSINTVLRKGTTGDKESDEKSKEVIDAMDKLFKDPAKARLHQPILAVRGVSAEHPLVKMLMDGSLKEGSTMTDPGFMSTTVNHLVSGFGKYKLHINVPKGAPGVYTGHPEGVSTRPDEWEVILNRGSKLRVTGTKGKNIIEVELIVD